MFTQYISGDVTYVTLHTVDDMAKGNSGRIVIDVDPVFKRDLYGALDRAGLTMREWFLRNAERYMSEQIQPSLLLRSGEEEIHQ